MAISLDEYKNYAQKLLDFTLVTYILLFFISISFFLAAFEINIPNSAPLLLVLTLGVFTWSLRFMMTEADDIQKIRVLLLQWTVVTLFGVIFILIIVAIYPIS
ncbi:MAG: hypothetical protein ACW981_09005 [Candidatus Hodarchaeales archaeon]|jgi:hypothetical protein